MRDVRKLLVQQLDKRIEPFKGAEKIAVPDAGWINAIRIALNMTLEQLGQRLHITRQGVKRVEESEAAGSISLKSMKEVAAALDMHFVYGFVPKDGSIENLVERKAEELAKKIVLRTNQNMKLENQGNSEQQIKQAIRDLTMELKREINKSLWQ